MGKKITKGKSLIFFLFLFSLQLSKSGVYLTRKIEYEHFWTCSRYIYLKGREEIFLTTIPLRSRDSKFLYSEICLDKHQFCSAGPTPNGGLGWIMGFCHQKLHQSLVFSKSRGLTRVISCWIWILSVSCVHTSVSICTSYDRVDTIQYSLSSHILSSAAMLL